MKTRLLFILMACLTSFSVVAQEEIYDFPSVPAEYPGGTEAMRSFIAENLQYPPVARANNIQGKVYLRFIVEKDGSLTNIEVLRGVSKELDKEAKRIVSIMPKWIPAKDASNKAIRTRYTVPVSFKTTP